MFRVLLDTSWGTKSDSKEGVAKVRAEVSAARERAFFRENSRPTFPHGFRAGRALPTDRARHRDRRDACALCAASRTSRIRAPRRAASACSAPTCGDRGACFKNTPVVARVL